MEKKIGQGKYTLNKVLGTGSFGRVYLAGGYAVKQIPLNLPAYLKSALENQIKILMSLSHQNIVQLIEVIYEKDFVYIVMEFCEEDLSKTIKTFAGNQKRCFDGLKQILLGFRELIRVGVVHRDLKPANVLVKQGTLKLADFGFAKFVDSSDGGLLRSCVGTPLYMSPQILKRETYTTKCDIWSIGVLFFEMLHGKLPWTGINEQNLLQNISSRPLIIGMHVGEQARIVLRKMLEFNESDRITWDQLFTMVLRQSTPSDGSKKFLYADLMRLLEIQLRGTDADQNQIKLILDSKRKEKLGKMQISKFTQMLDTFRKEDHQFIRDCLCIPA